MPSVLLASFCAEDIYKRLPQGSRSLGGMIPQESRAGSLVVRVSAPFPSVPLTETRLDPLPTPSLGRTPNHKVGCYIGVRLCVTRIMSTRKDLKNIYKMPVFSTFGG